MKDENYWSLVVEPGTLQAGIWKIVESTVDIHSVSKSRKWEEHELVEVADSVLSDAIKEFPENESEPSKTIFGVPPSWVESGQIKKDYLEKIRKICVDLSLSPSGFVVLPEAIAHATKIQEGSPLSGVVIGIGKQMVDVSLFKLGNLVGTVNVGRSISIIDDIVEGLVRFATKDALPTRIVLYGSEEKELEETKQEMIKTEWGDKANGKVKFMHIPQIEILSNKQKTVAVSIAGASEMSEINTVTFAGQPILVETHFVPDETEETTEILEETNLSPAHDLTAEDIGFVIDEDIEETEEPEFASADITSRPEHPTLTKKGFGFPKFPIPAFFTSKRDMPRHTETLKRISRPGVPLIGKVAIIMVLLLVLAIGTLGGAWWFMPKAEIAVFVSPKRLEEEQKITLDENLESPDTENLSFPIIRQTVEVSGDKSKQTTGTRTVGEAAKGSITIRNGTSQGVEFAAGTILVGPNSLEFSLDESASVSAALSPSEPGSVVVAATAGDIGPDYNLAQNESLSVGNYPKSEVDAVVSTSFSGGSSREIVAVSQADLDNLADELEEELKQTGLTDLESKIIDMRFIPDSVTTKVLDRDFSNSVGDEAGTVSMSMSVEVTGLAVSNPTIDSLSETILSDQVPPGFKLKREQVEVVFELVDDLGDGQYEFDLDITANLLPEVNIDDIKANVAGKYPPAAKDYLSTIPGFSSAEVSIRPRFPGRLGIIPFQKSKISVDIVAER